MKTSSDYLSQLTNIADDMAASIMIILRSQKDEFPVEVKTNRGVFNISVAKDSKTKRYFLKIDCPEKNVTFSQYTINPFVLADILEQVEKS